MPEVSPNRSAKSASAPLAFVIFRMLFGRPNARRRATADKLRHSPFWGAMLGIGISLVPLYIVLFVSNGMIQGITDRYLETSTYHIQINIPFQAPLEQVNAAIADILKIPAIRSAVLEIDGIALAASPAGSMSAQLRGLDQRIAEDPGFRKFITVDEGTMMPASSSEAVLGRYLAKTLKLRTGDTFTLLTLQGSEQHEMLPKTKIFRVAGIISTGYRELDERWCIVDASIAGRLLNPSTAYAFIGIKTTDPYAKNFPDLLGSVSRTASLYGFSPDEGSVLRAWYQIEQSLFKSFSSTRSVLILIMALAILIAVINLASAMTTFVIEHRTDIAILRSFGTSASQTARIFLMGGTVTGAIGCIAGSMTGVLISIYINEILKVIESVLQLAAALGSRGAVPVRLLNPDYYLERIPVAIDWRAILVIVGCGIMLSALASLIPASKSAEIAPAELIRHE